MLYRLYCCWHNCPRQIMLAIKFLNLSTHCFEGTGHSIRKLIFFLDHQMNRQSCGLNATMYLSGNLILNQSPYVQVSQQLQGLVASVSLPAKEKEQKEQVDFACWNRDFIYTVFTLFHMARAHSNQSSLYILFFNHILFTLFIFTGLSLWTSINIITASSWLSHNNFQ